MIQDPYKIFLLITYQWENIFEEGKAIFKDYFY